MSGIQQFLINNRFLINSALNQVQDVSGPGKTRLEPRVMQVLALLAANSEKIVTREELIKQVWNDYGGADEALTQAISVLRKVLDDPSKEMIRTIPKKGYLLQASVTQPDQSRRVVDVAKNTQRSRYLYPAIGIVVIIIGVLLVQFYFRKDEMAKPSGSKISTETRFPGNDKDEDNNPLTTITTTDSVGNRYRLIMIGDRRPEFYVNDSLQHNMEPYQGLIDKLAKQLWTRQKEAQNK